MLTAPSRPGRNLLFTTTWKTASSDPDSRAAIAAAAARKTEDELTACAATIFRAASPSAGDSSCAFGHFSGAADGCATGESARNIRGGPRLNLLRQCRRDAASCRCPRSEVWYSASSSGCKRSGRIARNCCALVTPYESADRSSTRCRRPHASTAVCESASTMWRTSPSDSIMPKRAGHSCSKPKGFAANCSSSAAASCATASGSHRCTTTTASPDACTRCTRPPEPSTCSVVRRDSCSSNSSRSASMICFAGSPGSTAPPAETLYRAASMPRFRTTSQMACCPQVAGPEPARPAEKANVTKSG